jgi:hypothetical protein
MDVGEWLRRLGLERYEQAFRENEIDEEVLPGLTADDLKDLRSIVSSVPDSDVSTSPSIKSVRRLAE